MVFRVYDDARGEFRWRAISGSDIVADGGQSYSRRRDAKRAIRSFRIKAILAPIQDVVNSKP
jgi:uncharacterized protein YegP (UPF0339 family)